MTRRVLIVLLAGLNLFLLACLVFTAYSPPSAFAQALPRAGDYLMIAAQTEADNDVLYLIDSKAPGYTRFGPPIRVCPARRSALSRWPSAI